MGLHRSHFFHGLQIALQDYRQPANRLTVSGSPCWGYRPHEGVQVEAFTSYLFIFSFIFYSFL